MNVVGGKVEDSSALEWDTPQREIEIPRFELTPPVNLGQWRRFVEATGYHPNPADGYLGYLFGKDGRSNVGERLDLPVQCVSQRDATNYCEWAGGQLPTEFELEVGMQRGYPLGLWLWTCDRWAEDRLKVEDLGTDGSTFGNRFIAVRGCGPLAGPSRYPFRPAPERRFFFEHSARLLGLGFCVRHSVDEALTNWCTECEEKLCDPEGERR